MNVVLGVQVDGFAQNLGCVVLVQVGLIKLKVCNNYVHNFLHLLQQFAIFT
jgi:hypothetical protein